MLVFIDAGHGGIDRGEVGKGGLEEKDVVLKLSIMEKKLFEKFGHEVIMARNGDDNIPLISRAEAANNRKADLYISNHLNIGGARGVEVLYSISKEISKELAEKVCEYISDVGLINRGAKTKRGIGGDYHLVIRETSMPAVIIEYGFIDSAYDIEFFKDDYFIGKLAEAVVMAVLQVFLDNESMNLCRDENMYDILLEGICMMTVNSAEGGRKYITNAVNDKLCRYGEVVDKSTGEVVFSLNI